MEKTLFEAMKDLFSTIEDHPEGKAVPRLYNNITIEFDVRDGESFYAMIRDGVFTFKKGNNHKFFQRDPLGRRRKNILEDGYWGYPSSPGYLGWRDVCP